MFTLLCSLSNLLKINKLWNCWNTSCQNWTELWPFLINMRLWKTLFVLTFFWNFTNVSTPPITMNVEPKFIGFDLSLWFTIVFVAFSWRRISSWTTRCLKYKKHSVWDFKKGQCLATTLVIPSSLSTLIEEKESILSTERLWKHFEESERLHNLTIFEMCFIFIWSLKNLQCCGQLHLSAFNVNVQFPQIDFTLSSYVILFTQNFFTKDIRSQ